MGQTALNIRELDIEHSQIEVRKATLKDVEDIIEMTRQAFMQYSVYVGGAEKLSALKDEYKDVIQDIAEREVFVALSKGNAVGSVRVQVMEDATAYLSRFAVLPGYQNKGVGKALLNAVDTRMEQLGVKQIYLHTAARATPLICCYYKRGFYIDSTSKDRGYIRALLCKEYKDGRSEAI
jgi:carbamoyl-phosphate synthase large subunit